MGSIAFQKTMVGLNVKEAYYRLVADAVDQYGLDEYNGTISTCSLGTVKKVFEKYNPETEKAASEFVESEEGGEKWQADVIDMGVDHLAIRRSVGTPHPYTSHYKVQYVVSFKETLSSPACPNLIFATKKKAEKSAVEYSLKYGVSCAIRKCPVLVSGRDVMKTFEVTEEVVEKARKLAPNEVLVVYHRYMFYGYAAT